MAFPKPIVLLHVPTDIEVEAHIAELTDALARQRMGMAWWADPAVDATEAEQEIDRYWDWTGLEIEWGGRVVRSRKLAAVTGDGAVQGAMMVSVEPVPCERAPESGNPALFVELLFVAPRNRHWVRFDKTEQFRGVGVQLLRTAAELSLEAGCAGRLKLESSPGFVGWYEKRGLLEVSADRILHEGVQYTPMELPADRVPVMLPERVKRRVRRGRKDQ